jgi:hypothetical protein
MSQLTFVPLAKTDTKQQKIIYIRDISPLCFVTDSKNIPNPSPLNLNTKAGHSLQLPSVLHHPNVKRGNPDLVM